MHARACASGRAAFGSATEKGTKYSGNIPSIAGSAGKAVTFAYNAIGVMYDYGADGPAPGSPAGGSARGSPRGATTVRKIGEAGNSASASRAMAP